jgi:hypothetical protein
MGQAIGVYCLAEGCHALGHLRQNGAEGGFGMITPARIRLALAFAMIGLLAVGGSLIPSPVAATSCSFPHCYGVVDWVGAPQNSGAVATISTTCLSGPNDVNNFADEEIWEGTNNDPNGGSWVEEGLSYGEINGQARGGPFWFWADQRPGYNYFEHYVSTASYGTNYVAKIKYNGSSSWGVYRGATLLGSSTPNPAWSQYMATGIEETNDTYSISGQSSALGWYTTANTLISIWQNGGNHPVLYEDHPPVSVYWISTNHTADYDAGACGGLSATATSTAATPTDLSSVVASVAASFGDSNATAQSVRTTRSRANALSSGAIVDTDQPVDLVILRGSFVGHNARVPRGQPLPVGSYLVLVVDAATNLVLDSGVTDRTIDLAPFGPSTTLAL